MTATPYIARRNLLLGSAGLFLLTACGTDVPADGVHRDRCESGRRPPGGPWTERIGPQAVTSGALALDEEDPGTKPRRCLRTDDPGCASTHHQEVPGAALRSHEPCRVACHGLSSSLMVDKKSRTRSTD